MLPLSQHWNELLQAWDVDRIKSEQRFDEVRKAYAGPGRFYHTLDHVHAVLGTVDTLASFAENPNAVKLAAWLHDVIYDSRDRTTKIAVPITPSSFARNWRSQKENELRHSFG
jgi:predicted metal-dependent HD superfamily phosphohydrolase